MIQRLYIPRHTGLATPHNKFHRYQCGLWWPARCSHKVFHLSVSPNGIAPYIMVTCRATALSTLLYPNGGTRDPSSENGLHTAIWVLRSRALPGTRRLRDAPAVPMGLPCRCRVRDASAVPVSRRVKSGATSAHQDQSRAAPSACHAAGTWTPRAAAHDGLRPRPWPPCPSCPSSSSSSSPARRQSLR